MQLKYCELILLEIYEDGGSYVHFPQLGKPSEHGLQILFILKYPYLHTPSHLKFPLWGESKFVSLHFPEHPT